MRFIFTPLSPAAICLDSDAARPLPGAVSVLFVSELIATDACPGWVGEKFTLREVATGVLTTAGFPANGVNIWGVNAPPHSRETIRGQWSPRCLHIGVIHHRRNRQLIVLCCRRWDEIWVPAPPWLYSRLF